MAKKNQIEKTVQNNRTFGYKKESVTLGFTLDLNKKNEMADFIELLTQAIIDVKAAMEEKQ